MGSDEESVRVVKNATDLQRLKLEKLMKNPEKPAFIPERPKEKKFPNAPEFVRNVMGSSAGAGSGEFHVYRHIRRREYARQEFLHQMSEKERLDYEYHCKLKENERSTAEKAAKKRAKRQRRKQHLRAKRSKGAPGNKNNSSSSSETEDSEESEEENVPGNSAEKDEEANKCEDRVKESDENCVVEVNGNNLPDSCDTNVSKNNMQDEKEEATSSDIPSEEKPGESTCTKKSLKELLNKNILKLKEKEDT